MTTPSTAGSPDHAVLVAFSILTIVIPAIFYVFALSENAVLVQAISFNLNLSVFSFALFAGVYCLAISSRANFFLAVPIIIVNVPNAVNDLLLTFWGGPISDAGASTASILTHIDIFFITATFILKSSSVESSGVNIRHSRLLFFVAVLLFFFSLVGWISASFLEELTALMFFGNGFQIRYLLYVSLLLIYVNENDCKNVLKGLYIAVGFLVCEAVINSYVYGYESLTSGNFATNTLGVVLGLILLCFKEFPGQNRVLFWLAAPVVLYAIVSTDTRSALWALTASIIASPAIRKFTLRQLASIGLFLLILISLFYADRALQFVSIVRELNYDSEVVAEFGLSSVVTRLTLWATTGAIIAQYPLGVGAASFNFLKEAYGFPIPVFIDPHTDFLNTIMQHGLIGGSVLIWLIYIYPAISTLTKGSKKVSFPISILIFLSLTSLSNSNLNKHQFFILALITIFVLGANIRRRNLKEKVPNQ